MIAIFMVVRSFGMAIRRAMAGREARQSTLAYRNLEQARDAHASLAARSRNPAA
jgi:hypothetical protein